MTLSPCSPVFCERQGNFSFSVFLTNAKIPVANATGMHGANDEARTRYLHLGKVALYQMSYVRISTFSSVPLSLSATCVIILHVFKNVNTFFQIFSDFFRGIELTPAMCYNKRQRNTALRGSVFWITMEEAPF